MCHSISKMHIVGEGPGETPLPLRCLSYLISSLLTDKRNLPVAQELQETGGMGSILGGEDALEERMATHSSILAWKIPWTEEPCRLQSMGLQESDTT